MALFQPNPIPTHAAFSPTDTWQQTAQQLEQLFDLTFSHIHAHRRWLFRDFPFFTDAQRDSLRANLADHTRILRALIEHYHVGDPANEDVERRVQFMLADEGMTPYALGIDEDPRVAHICTACVEPVTWLDVYRLPCGHHYCPECFRGMIKAHENSLGLQDSSCCTPSMGLVRQAMGGEYATEFLHKANERATPPQDRVYCFDKQCSTWLDVRGRLAQQLEIVCYKCKKNTCARCGEQGHGSMCSGPTAAERRRAESENLAKIKDEGDRRQCPACAQLLERNGGCPHFRCGCGVEFCWDCGKLQREGRCECMRRYMVWWTGEHPELLEQHPEWLG